MAAFTAFAMARIAAKGSRDLPSPRPAGIVVRIIDVALLVDEFITQRIKSIQKSPSQILIFADALSVQRPRLVIESLRAVRSTLNVKPKNAPVNVTQIKLALASVFEFQGDILELMLTPNDLLGNQIVATYETISDVFTGIGRGIGDIAGLIAFAIKIAPYAVIGYVGYKILGGEPVLGGKEKKSK